MSQIFQISIQLTRLTGNCTMQRKASGTTAVDLTGDGGILKTVLQEGSGEVIPLGAIAKVHYRGTLADGTVFDTSRTRGQPFKFTVGKRQVILGWDKGVATMKKGEISVLKCAPDYAYGNQHVGPIPANSVLEFEVELLDWAISNGKDSGEIPWAVIVIIFVGLFVVYRMFWNK